MVATALLAAAVTITTVPALLLVLRRFAVLDVPTERSSHERPVPRGGGVAVALGAATGLAVFSGDAGDARTGVLLTAAAFGLVGLAEDVVGVPPLRRFLLQVGAAVAALPWLLAPLDPTSWDVVFGLVAVVWIVAYVNAFNFMDGINGISVAQAIVAGVVWYLVGREEGAAALAAGGIVIAGAAAGFAPFNFPSAKLFLGDVGSYVVGGWLAALVVIGLRSGIPPEAVVAPLALYLADTGSTLLRRVRRGDPWHLPHREHAYQRLVRQGWSHRRTTLLVAAAVSVCSALGAVSLAGGVVARAAADVALAAVLVAYLVLPGRLERSRTLVSPVSS